MADILTLKLSPKQLSEIPDLEIWVKNKFPKRHARLLKKSLDARGGQSTYQLRVELSDTPLEPILSTIAYPKLSANAKQVIIVGFGPAGMFAALQCIELGLKPIVIEQGQKVKERRRDLAAINKDHKVNPLSNYCFGEGGAGTYSDGKLYTRSTKRGNVAKIFSVLVQHGAPEHILYEAHPHIGTNKLPAIVENMRETVLKAGGEIHFNTQFLSFITKDNKITGAKTSAGDFKGESLILATGHSARQIYEYLDAEKIKIEYKPFAVGFRIEHEQSFVNDRQYKGSEKEYLPPANYSLVCNIDETGVFSFCMCPGGIIAPCATAPNEIVTNGWSPSKRNNRFANAGIVTQISEEELAKLGYSGDLGGLQLQKDIEQKAGKWAEGSQKAPAQLALDFINGKRSKHLKDSSYHPGVFSADFNALFPKEIAKRLKLGLKAFDKKMPGFLKTNPMLIGPETRTSAPVRIPRESNLMHAEITGLFPCGEGAGYAGGIASAAMDGERCAKAVAEFLGVDV